jgi:hypothetical protein
VNADADGPRFTRGLRIVHGDDLGEADFAGLQTIRRTLLGLVDHGFITSFSTYGGHELTEYWLSPGDEDLDQGMLGLLDVATALNPGHWQVSVLTEDRPTG